MIAAAPEVSARVIVGNARANLLVGTDARDRVIAGSGSDRISVQYDGRRDVVRCGPARDIVNADRIDTVARDCEVVSRVLSRDPYRNRESQHETQVEPDSFAFGSTVVATYQVGRRFDGGASNIGWATSRNGGRTWRNGFLPGTTIFATPSGTAERISDPAVAYDAMHRVWLISTLAPSRGLTELYVSRSPDGINWGPPVVAARAATRELAYDKNWIVCDNGPRSPFRGRCYIAYTDHQTRRPRLFTLASNDGGLTWSSPILAHAEPNVGVQPVTRPDGMLVIPYLNARETLSMDSVASRDGGVTYTPPARIARVLVRDVPSVRAFPLPSVEVDARGTVYVAWHDCRFQQDCVANDIVLSRSGDGIGWSQPTRVPTAPLSAALNHFVPGLGVDPRTSAPRSRLAIVYHWTPTRTCGARPCPFDVGIIVSESGGARWGRPQRLSARSMPVGWISNTNSGRMTGDYLSTSFVAGRPIAVFSVAAQPRGERLRQAILATEPRP